MVGLTPLYLFLFFKNKCVSKNASVNKIKPITQSANIPHSPHIRQLKANSTL